MNFAFVSNFSIGSDDCKFFNNSSFSYLCVCSYLSRCVNNAFRFCTSVYKNKNIEGQMQVII